MRRATLKQKRFAQEYVKSNGNGTQSALKVYNAKSYNDAHAIASQNLQKLPVQYELNRLLQREELSLQTFTNKLSDITASEPAKGYSGSDIVEAVKTGLKLHGVLQDRKTVTSYNLNADLEKLSTYDLIERHKKIAKDTEAILQED